MFVKLFREIKGVKFLYRYKYIEVFVDLERILFLLKEVCEKNYRGNKF